MALKRSALDLWAEMKGKTQPLVFCSISQAALHQLYLFQCLQDFLLMQKGLILLIVKEEMCLWKESQTASNTLAGVSEEKKYCKIENFLRKLFISSGPPHKCAAAISAAQMIYQLWEQIFGVYEFFEKWTGVKQLRHKVVACLCDPLFHWRPAELLLSASSPWRVKYKSFDGFFYQRRLECHVQCSHCNHFTWQMKPLS